MILKRKPTRQPGQLPKSTHASHSPAQLGSRWGTASEGTGFLRARGARVGSVRGGGLLPTLLWSSGLPALLRSSGLPGLLWSSVLLTVLPVLPVQAAPSQGCDINSALRQTFGFLKAEAPASQSLAVLDAVMGCPEAETDAELLLYRAAILLRSGEVSRAIESARAARRAAHQNDDLRGRATRFLELIERRPELGADDKGLLHAVTFELEEGSALIAAVRITAVDRSTLPDESAWEEALPNALRFYAIGMNSGMVAAARQRCERSTEWPLKVWLPSGRYTLSTGQEIWVKDDRSFPLKEVRWAQSTPTATVGVGYLVPLSSSTTTCQPVLSSSGVEYAHRIGQNLLLSGGVSGFLPMGAAASAGICGSGAAGSDAAGSDAAVKPSMGLSLGVQRALTLMKDRPLLVGLAVGGFGVNQWVFYNASTDASTDASTASQQAATRTSPQAYSASYGLGLYLQPSLKLLLPLPRQLTQHGYLTVGGSVQLGGLLTMGLPDGYQASATPMLLPLLQAGGSWTF